MFAVARRDSDFGYKKRNISNRYPTLWNKVNMYFIFFLASYLVELGFSAIKQLLSKQRLKITECGDLRRLVGNFQPDVEKLIFKYICGVVNGVG